MKKRNKLVASFFIACVLVLTISVLALNDREGLAGDLALFAEMTESVMHNGRLESTIFLSTQDYIDRGISAIPVEERGNDISNIRGPYEGARNMLTFHHYLILYLLAPFTVFWSGVSVLTVAQVASFIFALWLMYLLLEENNVGTLLKFGCIALIISHPGFGGAIFGCFYPDKIFVFSGAFLAYSLVRKNESVASTLVAWLLCLSIGERASLYTGAFILGWVIFNFRETRYRFVKIIMGISALVYYYYLMHYVIQNNYYSNLSIDALVSNFLLSGYTELVVKFLIINGAFFLVISVFDLKAAIIGFGSLLPNILYYVGGAEKLGWNLHYHSYYFTVIIWAVTMGVIAANRKNKIVAGVFALEIILSLGLLLFEPYGRTIDFHLNIANSRNCFTFKTVKKIQDYSYTKRTNDILKKALVDTIPEGARVSSIEYTMPYLYKFTDIFIYPMNLESAEYLVTSYSTRDDGIILDGAVTYYSDSETRQYNEYIQKTIVENNFDMNNARVIPEAGIIIIGRKE